MVQYTIRHLKAYPSNREYSRARVVIMTTRGGGWRWLISGEKIIFGIDDDGCAYKLQTELTANSKLHVSSMLRRYVSDHRVRYQDYYKPFNEIWDALPLCSTESLNKDLRFDYQLPTTEQMQKFMRYPCTFCWHDIDDVRSDGAWLNGEHSHNPSW